MSPRVLLRAILSADIPHRAASTKTTTCTSTVSSSARSNPFCDLYPLPAVLLLLELGVRTSCTVVVD